MTSPDIRKQPLSQTAKVRALRALLVRCVTYIEHVAQSDADAGHEDLDLVALLADIRKAVGE